MATCWKKWTVKAMTTASIESIKKCRTIATVEHVLRRTAIQGSWWSIEIARDDVAILVTLKVVEMTLQVSTSNTVDHWAHTSQQRLATMEHHLSSCNRR